MSKNVVFTKLYLEFVFECYNLSLLLNLIFQNATDKIIEATLVFINWLLDDLCGILYFIFGLTQGIQILEVDHQVTFALNSLISLMNDNNKIML